MIRKKGGRPAPRLGESGKIGKFDAPPPAPRAWTRDPGPGSHPRRRTAPQPKNPLFPIPKIGQWENREIRLPPSVLGRGLGTGGRFTRDDRHSRWRDPRRPKNPLFPTPEIEAVGKSGNSTAPPRPSRGLWTRSRFPARGQRPAEKPTFP